MRAFFAFDIAEESIVGLERIVKTLSSEYGMIKWTKPHDFHVTAHFFQEVNERTLFEIIKDVGERLIVPSRPLTFELGQLRPVPGRDNPRLIWMRIAGDTKPLTVIQSVIQKIILQNGLLIDTRPFIPHITLGRIKKNNQSYDKVGDLQSSMQDCAEKIIIDALTLYQSEPTQQGPCYTALHTFPFSF